MATGFVANADRLKSLKGVGLHSRFTPKADNHTLKPPLTCTIMHGAISRGVNAFGGLRISL